MMHSIEHNILHPAGLQVPRQESLVDLVDQSLLEDQSLLADLWHLGYLEDRGLLEDRQDRQLLVDL